MSQSASIWRAKLAQQIAQGYPAPASLLVGSAARNLADAESDIDMLLYWENLPDAADRTRWIQQVGGRILTLVDSSDDEHDPALQSASESFFVGADNLRIDITHKTFAAVNKLIQDVTLHNDTHPVKLAVLNGMNYGMALTGSAQMTTFLHQITPPSATLQNALLAQWLEQFNPGMLARLVRRGDELLARRQLLEQCERMAFMLLVLNGKYPPLVLKHLAATLNELQHKPEECNKRFMTILQAPLKRGLDETLSLYTDMLDLVAAAGFDTSSARAAIQLTQANYHVSFDLNEESNHHA